MYYFNDLRGNKFGKLTPLEIVGRSNSRKMLWLCKCDCGNKCVVLGNSLTSGNTKSCGCSRYGNNKKYGSTKAHGQRLYNIWCGIKDRCYNKNSNAYVYYGYKGVIMCEEWLNDFCAFRDWALQNGYKDSLTIDRIDVNGNYEPLNCRWATMKEQANNRTNSHYLTFEGKTMTISEWAKELNIKQSIVRQRIWKGWTTDRALTQPVRILCHKKSC